ncbi:MAG: hypothetical protein Ct9H90mP6_07320 [Gammaproteobacteria bacterium]|nr:MAG: hypothetical protein Ct9H90mP6_07320 [Gammaproteobacteria bacterium]
MRNFLIIPILFIFLVSCSNSEDFDIPKISKLEKFEEHSNQFIKGYILMITEFMSRLALVLLTQ